MGEGAKVTIWIVIVLEKRWVGGDTAMTRGRGRGRGRGRSVAVGKKGSGKQKRTTIANSRVWSVESG